MHKKPPAPRHGLLLALLAVACVGLVLAIRYHDARRREIDGPVQETAISEKVAAPEQSKAGSPRSAQPLPFPTDIQLGSELAENSAIDSLLLGERREREGTPIIHSDPGALIELSHKNLDYAPQTNATPILEKGERIVNE